MGKGVGMLGTSTIVIALRILPMYAGPVDRDIGSLSGTSTPIKVLKINGGLTVELLSTLRRILFSNYIVPGWVLGLTGLEILSFGPCFVNSTLKVPMPRFVLGGLFHTLI